MECGLCYYSLSFRDKEENSEITKCLESHITESELRHSYFCQIECNSLKGKLYLLLVKYSNEMKQHTKKT